MMILLDVSLTSKLNIRNQLTLLSSAYPMKIASTVLGLIFLFFSFGIEILVRQPQILKNWILGVLPFQRSLENPIEDKASRNESFTQKVLGCT